MGITKTFSEQYNFWIVKCDEGHKITTWNEGDDIKDYSAYEIAYCPADADLDIYHCVTVDDDERLMTLQSEEIKKEELLAKDSEPNNLI